MPDRGRRVSWGVAEFKSFDNDSQPIVNIGDAEVQTTKFNDVTNETVDMELDQTEETVNTSNVSSDSSMNMSTTFTNANETMGTINLDKLLKTDIPEVSDTKSNLKPPVAQRTRVDPVEVKRRITLNQETFQDFLSGDLFEEDKQKSIPEETEKGEPIKEEKASLKSLDKTLEEICYETYFSQLYEFLEAKSSSPKYRELVRELVEIELKKRVSFLLQAKDSSSSKIVILTRITNFKSKVFEFELEFLQVGSGHYRKSEVVTVRGKVARISGFLPSEIREVKRIWTNRFPEATPSPNLSMNFIKQMVVELL